MSLGFVMLCHTALGRAAQVARHWATRGCPVVIHVDKRVRAKAYDRLRADLADLTDIRFLIRYIIILIKSHLHCSFILDTQHLNALFF